MHRAEGGWHDKAARKRAVQYLAILRIFEEMPITI